MYEEKKRVGAGFGVILERNGKILLGKRHPDPDKADSAFRSAGEWSLPGGKLEWGESIEDGAIREVKEETGITIKNPEVISVHNCKSAVAPLLSESRSCRELHTGKILYKKDIIFILCAQQGSDLRPSP